MKTLIEPILYLQKLTSDMLKKSYLFFLLTIIPLWGLAFVAQQTEINFVTLEQTNSNIESAISSCHYEITYFESAQFDFLQDSRSKSPVENKGSEDSSEPEEKEQKTNEDQDSGSNHYACLIKFTKTSPLFVNVNDIENALVNTPLYILFHSWKSYLV